MSKYLVIVLYPLAFALTRLIFVRCPGLREQLGSIIVCVKCIVMLYDGFQISCLVKLADGLKWWSSEFGATRGTLKKWCDECEFALHVAECTHICITRRRYVYFVHHHLSKRSRCMRLLFALAVDGMCIKQRIIDQKLLFWRSFYNTLPIFISAIYAKHM